MVLRSSLRKRVNLLLCIFVLRIEPRSEADFFCKGVVTIYGLKIAGGPTHLAGENTTVAAFNQCDLNPTRNKVNMITHKLN